MNINDERVQIRIALTVPEAFAQAAADAPSLGGLAGRDPRAQLGERLRRIDVGEHGVVIHLNLGDEVGVLFDKPPRALISR